MRLSGRLREFISGLRKSESGNIAMISALALPALIGFCGLGADTGYWFFRQRALQGAVDVTAYNGAVKLRGGASESDITSSSSADATFNSWDSSIGTIAVHTPPISGTHIGDIRSVEVILTENEPRYFTQLFSTTPVTITVRAVGAFNSSGDACVLALNKTIAQAVKIWGNNNVTMNGCDIMSNSFSNTSVAIGGSSVATVPCVIAVGQVSVTSTLNSTDCAGPINNAVPAQDPYATLPAPAIPAGCSAVPGAGAIPSGKYCGGMTLQNTRTLSGGVYVISGGTLKINAGANISGSNVTFYLTNGATLQMNGGAHLNISAPTSGTYSGVLFFGDRTMANAVQKVNGDSTSTLTGAIYFPSQSVEFLGNFSGNNGCMRVIADTVTLSGSTTMNGSCPGTGLNSIPIPGQIALVE